MKKRESTQEAYQAAVNTIKQEWRHRKVVEIDSADVDARARITIINDKTTNKLQHVPWWNIYVVET
jgi:hypothetical protein